MLSREAVISNAEVKKGVNSPLITIITSTFNAEDHLQKTIDSVRNQSYKNIEYIVVDGRSTDKTVAIILANQEIINRWVSEPDSGIYDAWNKGVEISNGDWIAFLGAGDEYVDDAIENYVNFINSTGQGGLEYVSSRVELFSENRRIRVIGSSWSWGRFLKYMCVAHVGSFHKKSLFSMYGLFNRQYKICGDYEFLLRPRKALRAGYFGVVTARMSLGGVSMMSPRVFSESAMAKNITGGRLYILCWFEKYLALLKWTLKKYFQ